VTKASIITVVLRIFETAEEMGDHVARRVLKGIADARGRAYLLGCPTGRTPRPAYRAMASILEREPTDLSHLVLVMMDEYLVTDPATGKLRLVDSLAHYSCLGFAEREIVTPLNASVPAAMRMPAENVWFPDPEEPEEYDRRISAAGGIDCFLLASGASDGHVAFNPPGSDPNSRSRVIELAEETRRDNLKTFPDFTSLDMVPRYGVSVGLATIRAARHAILMLIGTGKREAFARVTRAAGFDPSWPATTVLQCASHDIVADRAAAETKEIAWHR
jgi:glucosamine-6-phosphate deaminase